MPDFPSFRSLERNITDRLDALTNRTVFTPLPTTLHTTALPQFPNNHLNK